MDNIIVKIFTGIAIALLLFLLALIVNVIVFVPEAKNCVKNGGEPYYFITSFECRNNVNVNLGGE